MSKKVKKKVKNKNKDKAVKDNQQLDTVVKNKSENGELPISDEEYQDADFRREQLMIIKEQLNRLPPEHKEAIKQSIWNTHAVLS